MVTTGLIKVLLVEDDEDDYLIIHDLFAEIPGNQFTLDWTKTFETGLAAICRNQHDVCLVDYRLGAKTGLELLRAAVDRGCPAPIILLTGTGGHQIDVEAMQAGASDYLIKGQFRADSLGRSIRYALQRKRAAAVAAFEQARLAAFGAEVGLGLARRDSLDALLASCARAMVQYLNAAAAQIATYEPADKTFRPRATAGPICESLAPNQTLPPVKLDPAALAQGKPLLLKQLLRDDAPVDQEWVKREGLASYAAFPLVLEDQLVGLMSLFTQQPLTEQILQELGSVANGVALCIQRKRSEEALDRSEGKYRSVVESIKEVIFQMDAFGNWVFLNPAWTAVTGFEIKQTLGTFFLEYVYPEDQEHNRHIFLKLIERNIDYCRYETRFVTQGGKVRWLEVFAQPILNPEGTAGGLSGTLIDVTDHKLAEVQIQKLAAFPQLSPNPVLEFSGDGTLTYANNAAQEMVKSLGKPDLISILPPDASTIVRECLASGQKRLGLEIATHNRILTWSFFPIAASHVVHVYGADITEVLNLESQLRHAQKLESVGQLAAGVAHDFNNILTVIQGYSESLLARWSADATATGPLKQISVAAQRAATLTRQLLLFSRKQVIQPKLLDLNSVLQNLVKMLGRLVGEDIALETEYAATLPAIEADTGMLEQVVMNLAVNSRDAMPKGGRLLIATSSAEIDEAYTRHHADARTGRFICLSVADTGCGMDRKTLERIFEPFFTTKEVGKGTGLGLATVYGIVKQHKGWIEVTSEPGRGTTFKIYFPATAEAPKPADQSHTNGAASLGRQEIIFLVEDDHALRELIREVLSQYKYRVVEAASGVEALQVWDKHNGQVDLLLTDMVMPDGMSGRDLSRQLRKRRPDLKVIYSSGYSEEIMGSELSHEGAAFIPKPYNPLQLAQLVRQVLDSPGPSPEQIAAAQHEPALA
ncbi:MAG TPA: response regulator [Candidatus Binatia bacterium]|jgi:two-component system cell cycle sensor histidine kinase/response regulator CckA|nr:response regulator [Candidatus Binatia bacterium]